MMTRAQHAWREEDGIIYFSVTSDGTTHEQWPARLEGKGFRGCPKRLVFPPNFQPTSGIITEIAIIKGALFGDNDRFTGNIHAEAERRRFRTPNTELVCLVREKFADRDLEAMGFLWIVVMRNPFDDYVNPPPILHRNCIEYDPYVLMWCLDPSYKWSRDGGFAFAVSPTSAEASADKQGSS